MADIFYGQSDVIENGREQKAQAYNYSVIHVKESHEYNVHACVRLAGPVSQPASRAIGSTEISMKLSLSKMILPRDSNAFPSS